MYEDFFLIMCVKLLNFYAKFHTCANSHNMILETLWLKVHFVSWWPHVFETRNIFCLKIPEQSLFGPYLLWLDEYTFTSTSLTALKSLFEVDEMLSVLPLLFETEWLNALIMLLAMWSYLYVLCTGIIFSQTASVTTCTYHTESHIH